MKIHNALPHLIECLLAWEKAPSEDELNDRYLKPLEPLLRPMLEDFERYGRKGLHAVVTGLDWPTYRKETLAIDPAREEARLRTALEGVARETGVALEGEVVLFGSFTLMDGYARFDRGTHRVFLGADESHGRGVYHDILFSHELTHVARESRPTVWTGWGLDPKMDHDGFTASQTVIEHLMNEGLACAVSERLVPTKESWDYCYQTEDSLAKILQHGPALDRVIHAEIEAKGGHYYHLYDTERYEPEMPSYCHYAWAWMWVRTLLAKRGLRPQDLVPLCSKEFIADALAFRLADAPRP